MDLGLQRVVIQNFLSHKNTVLDLHSGVNTIIGDTDNGKSAAFKALMWLFTGKPLGDEFRSWWGGDTHVSAVIDNVHVGRVKNSTKNYYYVGEDKPANRLEDLRKGVPEPVLKLFRLDEVNFQGQMSLPFLLSQSAGKVGKFLNDAADLNVIDRAIAGIASMLRKEKSDLETAKENLKQYTEDLKAYDWLDSADIELIQLERVAIEVQAISQQSEALDKLLNEIDAVESDIEKLQPILAAGHEIERLVGLSVELVVLNEDINNLDNLLNDIDSTEADIEKHGLVLLALPAIDRLIYLQTEIEALKNQEAMMSSLLEQIRSVEVDLKKAQQDRDKYEKEYHNAFPANCPLCGQEVKG